MTLSAFPKPGEVEGREELSAAKLSKIRRQWWEEGKRECGICHKTIFWFEDYTLDHRVQGKMGQRKDSRLSNLQPAHWMCNYIKGSRRDLGGI